MKLSNGKMSLHLEISEDAYWALTAIAAEDRMHVEEWLEGYLDEHCSDPKSLALQVLQSKDLEIEAGYIARLLVNDDGLNPVALCNILAKISGRIDALQGIPTVKI